MVYNPREGMSKLPKWAWAPAGLAVVSLGWLLTRPDVPEPIPAPAVTSTVVAPASTTTTSTTPPTTVVALGPAQSLVRPEQAPPSDEAVVRSVAGEFVSGWLTRDTPDVRRGLLADVTAPRLLPSIVDVDLDQLPVAALASVGRVDSDGYRATAVARLTDGSTVTVSLSPTATGWRVTDITPGGTP